ncbi:39551_t:CDS:1, partial [Gigaspora margarita]
RYEPEYALYIRNVEDLSMRALCTSLWQLNTQPGSAFHYHM